MVVVPMMMTFFDAPDRAWTITGFFPVTISMSDCNNAAALFAIIKVLRGQQIKHWEPQRHGQQQYENVQ